MHDGSVTSDGPGGLSRRAFVSRSAVVAGAALFAQVPGFIARQSWLDEARAQTPDMTHDTLNGFVAFVVPGPDAYSVAQGQSTPEPGGIDAGGTPLLIETINRYAGASASSGVPAAEAIATMLNQAALRVNPSAAAGTFVSPFARLRFEEKVEAMRQLEQDTEGSVLRALSGTLIAVTALLCYSEGGVLDRNRRETTGQPVGWTLSRYDGVAEGRKELIGYWKGKRSSRTASQYRVGRR